MRTKICVAVVALAFSACGGDGGTKVDYTKGDTAMEWRFSPECASAGTIEARLFDTTHRLEWPADNSTTFAIPVGVPGAIDMSCVAGSNICFGAHGTASALYWGVDVDLTKACTTCCYACAAGQTPIIPLTCL